MADPNVTTNQNADTPLSPLLQWLVPLAGAAMTAYSPAHLGAGVGAFNQLFGNINAIRRQQQASKALAGLPPDTPDTTTTLPASTTMQPSASPGALSQTPPARTFSITGNKNVASGIGLGLQSPTPATNLNQTGDTGSNGKKYTDASFSDLAPGGDENAVTTPAETQTIPGHHTSVADIVKALATSYPQEAAQLGANSLTQQMIWGNRLGIEGMKETGRNTRNQLTNQTRLTVAQERQLAQLNGQDQATVRDLYNQGAGDLDTIIAAVKSRGASGLQASPIAGARENALNNPPNQFMSVTEPGGAPTVVSLPKRGNPSATRVTIGGQTVQPGNVNQVNNAELDRVQGLYDNQLDRVASLRAKLREVMHAEEVEKLPEMVRAMGQLGDLESRLNGMKKGAGLPVTDYSATPQSPASGSQQGPQAAPQQQVSIGQRATNKDGSKVQWNGSQWQPMGLVNGQWVPLSLSLEEQAAWYKAHGI